MKVSKEEITKTEVALTIEVTVEEMKPYLDNAAKAISKEVEVKGFRKGKAPYDAVVAKVGEQTLYEEAFNELVNKTYADAVDQEELQVVGRANIDVVKLAPGNPVVYKATVPLMPTVTLGDYKTKLKTKKEEATFSEEKYEKTMNDLRGMRAKEVVVDRAAKTGDKVKIDFDVQVDGVSIEGGQGQGQMLELGSGKFIPGFEEAVEGMKKGEEKTFDVTFPEDYFKDDLKGKAAKVDVKTHDVYEVEMPELNDEFAKEMNFESLEQLEKEVKLNIERELEQESNHKFENEVIDEVVKLSTFDPIPEQLVSEEVEKMIRELMHDVGQQGVLFEDYLQHLDKTEDDLRSDFREKAEARLKAALAIREVAVAEDIKVEKEELEKEMEEMKKAYENMPEMMAQIEAPQHVERLQNMLIHKKLFAALEGYAGGKKPAKKSEKKDDKKAEAAPKKTAKKAKKDDK